MNMKFISGILVSLVLFMAFASVASAVTVDITTLTSSPAVAAGKPGDVITYTLTVANTGTTPINVQFSHDNLKQGTVPINLPAITPVSNLINGTPQTVSFAVTIPITATGTYTGTITASEVTAPTNIDSIPITLFVSSLKAVDVTSHSTTAPLIFRGQDGDTRASTLTIKNVGTEILSGLTFVKDDTKFADANSKKALVTFENVPSSIQPGQSATINVNLAIERGMDLGSYGDAVNVTSGTGVNLVQDSFKLDIRVQPEVCDKGPIGKVRLQVSDPDSGDEFKPGERIKLDINVDNDYTNDLDVVVEAFLYNLDDENELSRAEDTKNVDEGDSVDFDLELTMPLDDDNKESDTYVVFVKAYEDGDEDKHCAEDSVEINLNREKDDVVVTKFVATPTTLSCGDSVLLESEILNVGTKDQDNVYIEFKQPDLKLSTKSQYFDLQQAGSDEDSRANYRTTLVIPSDAAEKSYDFEGIVYFKNGAERASKFATVAVSQCGPVKDVLTVSSTSFDVQSGNTFVVPFTLNNKKNSAETYTVELNPVGGWATIATKQLVVAASGSISDSLTLTPSTSVKTGAYTATLSVKSGSTVIGSQTLNVKVAGTTAGGQFVSTTSQFKMDTITILLIVAIVVLLILIIVLAVVMTRKDNARVPVQPAARR